MMRLKILYYYLKSKFALQPKTRAELDKLQKKKFLDFQRKVLSKSNYFRHFWEKDLSNYPLMNKKIMMDFFFSSNSTQHT